MVFYDDEWDGLAAEAETWVESMLWLVLCVAVLATVLFFIG